LAALERLPPDRQDAIVRAILVLVRNEAWTEIAPQDLPFVLAGLAEIARGEFATDGEVEVAFRSFMQ
jgi:predicted transcriptional regulator